MFGLEVTECRALNGCRYHAAACHWRSGAIIGARGGLQIRVGEHIEETPNLAAIGSHERAGKGSFKGTGSLSIKH